MDTIEFTKYASMVLVSLLLIFGGRVLIEELTHKEPTTVGYKLPDATAADTTADAKDGSAAAAPKAGFDASTIVASVATADTAAGAKYMKKCAACHSWDAGGKNKVGPSLWGIVDRPIAGLDSFSNYSDALKAKGGSWSIEELATFLHNPKKAVKGTGMIFAGIKKDKDLANILAYLNSLK